MSYSIFFLYHSYYGSCVHVKNSTKFKYVKAELSEAEAARKIQHLIASVATKMKIFEPKWSYY